MTKHTADGGGEGGQSSNPPDAPLSGLTPCRGWGGLHLLATRATPPPMVTIRPVPRALVPVNSDAADRISAPNYDEFQSDHEIWELLQQRPEQRIQLLLMTSDRGLAGAFNSNLIKAAQRFLDAAEIISRRGEAMQLRYLTTLTSIASERAATIVFPFPMDVMRLIGGHRR